MFVSYPLIGSESLKCSVIFNSRYFFPNEKRSGIALEKGDKANINRQVLSYCQKLYAELLKFAVRNDFTNIHNLKISAGPNVSANFNEILVKPVIQTFINESFIETTKSGFFVSLKKVLMPQISTRSFHNLDDEEANLLLLHSILNQVFGNQNFLIKNDYNYIKTWLSVFKDPDWIPHLDYSNSMKPIT